MPSKLDEIIAYKREQVAALVASADRRALEDAAERYQPRGFRENLRHHGQSGPAIIAEIKKASPSKGLIRADFHVAEMARELADAGASALSVLTDEKYFQGSLSNLEIASREVAIPCLRKDFTVDEFQIIEARAHGADAILLIVAALSQPDLVSLHRHAQILELDVLCEVHDAPEMERALDAGCKLIGVNNRNLHTFQVDLATSLDLAGRMPQSVTKVSESGIEKGEDIARLHDAGFDAFLIGESLMRARHPGDALRELLAKSKTPAAKS